MRPISQEFGSFPPAPEDPHCLLEHSEVTASLLSTTSAPSLQQEQSLPLGLLPHWDPLVQLGSRSPAAPHPLQAPGGFAPAKAAPRRAVGPTRGGSRGGKCKEKVAIVGFSLVFFLFFVFCGGSKASVKFCSEGVYFILFYFVMI